MAGEQTNTNAGLVPTHEEQIIADTGLKGGDGPSKISDSQMKGAGELEYKKVPNDAWTEEQDKTLFRLKVEQKPWGDITKEIGKDKHACTLRWKEIMPENFYKNESKGGTKGGNQGSKHDSSSNQKGSKQEQENHAKSAEPPSEDLLGFAAWPSPDEAKSTASDKASKKNEKDVNGAADSGGWGSADGATWNNTAAVDTGETPGWATGDASGGSSWPTGNDENTGDTPNWAAGSGDDTWNVDSGKDESKEKKGEKGDKGGESRKQEHKRNTSTTKDQGSDGDKGKRGSSSSKRSASRDGKHHKSSDGRKNNNRNSTGNASWPNDNNDPSNNNNGTGSAAAAVWGDGNGDAPWAASSDEKKQVKEASDGGFATGGWGDVTSPKEKERHPKKHSSHREFFSEEKHKSRHHNPGLYHSEYKVSPDDTFSQDELKLIARILQQDCSMVWERVSWRFKDKTGRALHPHVFEKKITGRLEKDRKE